MPIISWADCTSARCKPHTEGQQEDHLETDQGTHWDTPQPAVRTSELKGTFETDCKQNSVACTLVAVHKDLVLMPAAHWHAAAAAAAKRGAVQHVPCAQVADCTCTGWQGIALVHTHKSPAVHHHACSYCVSLGVSLLAPPCRCHL